jgi:membrane-bound serine protease (ClpP class)
VEGVVGSELTDAIWSVLTNPNVVYLLLIVGLWAAAAAVYVPGTGLLEGAAVIFLVLAVVGLTQLPTRVVGVLLIVVSGALFLVDLKVQSVAITVGGVASLVVGSVFLFRPAADEPAAATGELSPWLIALVALGSLVFFTGAVAAVLRSQRLRAKVDAGSIVGQRGVVTAPIDPVGTVQVQSELWTAVSETSLSEGEEVQVVALEGLRLRVQRASAREEGR